MRGTPYVHGDFRGGLNTKAAAYLLEDSQCRDCLNVQSTTTGAIVKRNGTVGVTLSASLTGQPLMIYNAESLSDKLIVTTPSKVYSINTATNPATVTDLSVTTTNGYWSVVEATSQGGQGPAFMSNGVDTPQYFNGTTATAWTAASGTLPNGKYLTIHESRIFSANTSTSPSSLYWSDVLVGTGTLPRTWPAENVQFFDPDDGDQITGIGKVGSNLAVFKAHKVFVLYDTTTGANRRLTTSIGCIAPRSIVETPMGTIFLSDQGVYLTNGSGVQLLSDQITPTIAQITSPELCTAVLHKNHYYLASPTDGKIYDFDLVLKSWWVHSISGAVSDFATSMTSSDQKLYGITLDGKLGRLFVDGYYTDFGSPFSWTWKGPWLTPGQARVVYPAVRKRLRAMRVDGSGHVALGVSKDFYEQDALVTAQAGDGSSIAELFPQSASTVFGPNTGGRTGETVTFCGDFDNSTDPDTPTGPTTFGDVSPISQARVWGQGVARSWAFTFSGANTDATDPGAAIIENYTIFTQERNQ